jgi:hypothetical protein
MIALQMLITISDIHGGRSREGQDRVKRTSRRLLAVRSCHLVVCRGMIGLPQQMRSSMANVKALLVVWDMVRELLLKYQRW